MDAPELSKTETAVKSDIAEARTNAIKVDSWLKANWHYAAAFAVAGLILGLSLGYKLGLHSHL